MLVYMFLADGFEETEALVPLDLLRRAGAEAVTVSVSGSRTVTGSHGIKAEADILPEEARFSECAAVILPGGGKGTENLSASELVRRTVTEAAERNALICAICAAPTVLAELGLLTGKKAVCFPSMTDMLTGAVVSDAPVVRDGSIITARGMGVSYEFGLTVVAALFGDNTAAGLRASTCGI